MVKVAPGKIDLVAIAAASPPADTARPPRTTQTVDIFGEVGEDSTNKDLHREETVNVMTSRQNAERPRKKRRTGESEVSHTEAVIDKIEIDEIGGVDVIDDKSMEDRVLSGRESEGQFESSSEDKTRNNPKEKLLLKKVQHLRDVRRLKAEEISIDQSDVFNSSINFEDSSIILHPSSTDKTLSRRSRPSIEHFASHSPYPFSPKSSQQKRLPQHGTSGPTSSWAVPLRAYMANNSGQSSSSVPHPSSVSFTHPGSVAYKKNPSNDSRYFGNRQLPYDSAIVSASYHSNSRGLDITNAKEPQISER